MVDTLTETTLSRWTFAAIAFGIVCNASFWVFVTQQEYYAGALDQPMNWGLAILATALLVMPSLAMLVFCRQQRVVFTYASVIFLLLFWRVQYRYEDLHKWDGPAVVLMFLGMISAMAILVRAGMGILAVIRK